LARRSRRRSGALVDSPLSRFARASSRYESMFCRRASPAFASTHTITRLPSGSRPWTTRSWFAGPVVRVEVRLALYDDAVERDRLERREPAQRAKQLDGTRPRRRKRRSAGALLAVLLADAASPGGVAFQRRLGLLPCGSFNAALRWPTRQQGPRQHCPRRASAGRASVAASTGWRARRRVGHRALLAAERRANLPVPRGSRQPPAPRPSRPCDTDAGRRRPRDRGG
jgi:hypothetical protein